VTDGFPYLRFAAAFVASFASLSACGLLIAWALVPAPPTYFRTSYFELALPPGWRCEREGTEHVCAPATPPPHEAIIILAAKLRNQNDNREAYTRHLLQPREFTAKDGTAIRSDIVHVRELRIGSFTWVDGLHFQSEVPNYYTRYLATGTAQIGVLITFSAHRDSFEAQSPKLEAAIRSMTIYQAPSVFN